MGKASAFRQKSKGGLLWVKFGVFLYILGASSVIFRMAEFSILLDHTVSRLGTHCFDAILDTFRFNFSQASV